MIFVINIIVNIIDRPPRDLHMDPSIIPYLYTNNTMNSLEKLYWIPHHMASPCHSWLYMKFLRYL